MLFLTLDLDFVLLKIYLSSSTLVILKKQKTKTNTKTIDHKWYLLHVCLGKIKHNAGLLKWNIRFVISSLTVVSVRLLTLSPSCTWTGSCPDISKDFSIICFMLCYNSINIFIQCEDIVARTNYTSSYEMVLVRLIIIWKNDREIKQK